MYMKRFGLILIVLALAISICACGRADDGIIRYGNLLDTVYDGNSFVTSPEVEWGSDRNDFIRTLPGSAQMDPQSEFFVDFRNTEMPNGHFSVQPPAVVEFADLAVSTLPCYLFDENDKLYCASYSIIMDESLVDDFKSTFRTIVSMICEKRPEAPVSGSEYLATLNDINFDNDSIQIIWYSDDQNSFIRLSSTSFHNRYILDVTVALSSYFKTYLETLD